MGIIIYIMSPEQPQQINPTLTPEQEAMAVFLVEQCDLEEHTGATLEMMGQTGTVEYGLGRCAHHLLGMTPEEIKDMVLTKLEQQERKR